jgi:ABC-type transporter MlaC component
MVDAVKRLHRTGATLSVLALAFPLAVSPVAPLRAWAGAPTDAMRDFFGAVNVVLTDPRTDGQPMEKLRAIRRHVDGIFDFREAAMLALGREWSPRSALEQNEFVVHFADLLERSFVWRMAGKAALGGGVKVDYVGETVHGDSATVDTAVAARDGSDLRLQYRMVHRAGRWVVRDVVMNGVSTMENYHAQFQRVVRDRSWRNLMGQLRAKVGASAVAMAVAAPASSPVPRPSAVVGPPAPPELDRPIPEERRAIARDVAEVVTPGLDAHDAATLPPLRSAAPVPRERRAAPAPPRISAAVLATAQIARPAQMSDAERAGVRAVAAAAPAVSVQRSPAPGRGVSRTLAPSATYWIQVGAYRNPTMAGRAAERVKGEILIAPTRVAGDPLLRVRIGPFSSRVQALARLAEYRSLGYQPFVAAD